MSENLEPKKDNFITHICDLLSGRVLDMFTGIHNLLLGRGGYGQRIQNLEIFMTNEEQKLTNAAQAINKAVAGLKAYQESVKAKFEKLSEQAQAPVAATEPVDLSQEFAEFDNAMEGLTQFSATLKGESSSGEDSGHTEAQVPSGGLVDNSVAQSAPFSPQVPISDPGVHEPIPLAGSSGVTNPPDNVKVGEGQVFAGQSQPGTSVPMPQNDSSLPEAADEEEVASQGDSTFEESEDVADNNDDLDNASNEDGKQADEDDDDVENFGDGSSPGGGVIPGQG